MNVYDFSATSNTGELVGLQKYKGKVLLIVNTATGCGFTPQYEGLEKLFKAHHEQGFEILDFPCNQFGHQAPGSDDEIHQFCTMRYNTTFDRFSKIDVNGKNAHPLYQFLKSQKGGVFGKAIKWNFTKFLIAKDGTVVARYAPTVKPEEIEKDIEKLL